MDRWAQAFAMAGCYVAAYFLGRASAFRDVRNYVKARAKDETTE